jgi:hypothetical protein
MVFGIAHRSREADLVVWDSANYPCQPASAPWLLIVPRPPRRHPCDALTFIGAGLRAALDPKHCQIGRDLKQAPK